MEVELRQDDETRREVHARAVRILRAIENGEEWPRMDSNEQAEMTLELLYLMTAGDWLEAQKA